MLETATVVCPSCWTEFEIPVDCSGGDQEYTEDCTACCSPARIRVYVTAEGELSRAEALAEGD